MKKTAVDRKPKTAFEYSAGGIVTKDGKFLMVQVENLQGEVLWTFPKGHLDGEETSQEAALREVEEETGYRCKILEPLTVIRYFFMKSDKRIGKQVKWFWMEPESKTGSHDADEILKVQWMTPEAAREELRYPGDFKLLDMVLQKLGD